ncbi:PREDICTED: oxytocin receptor-like [Priapulus caudatus]|uniref:Oxytocin receptor-like n=1 Tax=Priapulus caudatus TaxID=37621 RepID=A0ABM1EH05_PRICU|nr:PREDICTED: oxytocin receptor-like [Priapulus caudatus]
MHYFMLHLSVADLVVAFFNVLPQLAWDVTYRFQGGNDLCKFVKFAQVFGMFLSTYVLLVMAADRWAVICRPLVSMMWTPRMAHARVAAAWLLSGVLSLPQLFLFSYRDLAYVLWTCCVMFVLPTLLLAVMYTWICVVVWGRFHATLLPSAAAPPPPSPSGASPRTESRDNSRGSARTCRHGGKQEHSNSSGSASACRHGVTHNSNNRRGASASESRGGACACRHGDNEKNSNDRSGASVCRHGGNAMNSNDRKGASTCRHGGHQENSTDREGASACRHGGNEENSNSRGSASACRHGGRDRLSRAKVKTVKMTLAVVLCFVVCWTPFFLTTLWFVVDERHAVKTLTGKFWFRWSPSLVVAIFRGRHL